MIRHLCIRNYAVIDDLDLEFGPGLNLLTGETGAGKSVIVDAIGIALGERADSETVRSGSDRAVVEAVMEVSKSPEAVRILENAGHLPEDGCIVITREVHKAGKSQCRINGRPATVSLIKEVTDRLVDTHGQHEHQFLLKPERHSDVLDAWCGENVLSLRAQVSRGYSELRRLQGELDQLRSDVRERARTIDLYQFQSREISEAGLTPGEDQELLADRNRLANAEKLSASASSAFGLLGDRSGDRCAVDLIGEALSELQGIADLDPEVQSLAEALQSAFYQAEDVSRELRAFRDAVEFNPERLEAVEERLDLIRTLKRKYGDTIEEIAAYGQDLERKLESLVNSEERSDELEREIERLAAEVTADARKLSELRAEGASKFGESVEQELEVLNMPSAVFQVEQNTGDLTSNGMDRIEFLISANPGEEPRPLARIASGGEMSRIMLAIKSVMAEVDDMPALVFDEIDVGVGGRTADVIGRKLGSLANRAQVLCITHLPQIASLPGDHYSIEKQVANGRTVVRVRKLADEERIQELARMLGGAKPSETAIQHAREMLARR